MIGPRNAETARDFIGDLAARLKGRVQLSTDGLPLYLEAVENAFGCAIDYAMLIKAYGSDPEGQKRYSPAKCIGCETKRITGTPDLAHINTSFVERQNLTVRMTNRRFTRLTNAFSRKIENHSAAVALGYFAYNFIKDPPHASHYPRDAAGVTHRLWEVSDLVAAWEASVRTLERAASAVTHPSGSDLYVISSSQCAHDVRLSHE